MGNSHSAVKIGMEAENAVAASLEALGFIIADRNFHTRFGEIDIIAISGSLIVFVEVKCRRRSSCHGRPSEAVTIRKQRKIIKTAAIYINEKELFDKYVRFDVAEVYGWPDGKIKIIEGAFDLSSAGVQEGFF